MKVSRISIVGGGIGGLSAALTLQHFGYRVSVFEQARELREIGAGVTITPNARLRRCRTPILRESYCEALKDILEGLFRRKQITCPGLRAEKLAQNWFTEKDAKEEARNLLMEFELDESDVDAEAVRRSLDDLERVDKSLMANEFRRDKALISIAAFRSSLAKNLRKSSDRLIEAEANEIPLLAAPSVSQSPG